MAIMVNEIMTKVRTIFFLRKFGAPFVFLVLAMVVLGSTVSISHVITNMPAFFDIPAVARFLAAAFAHTELVVKSALVAGIIFLLVTVKGLAESIRLSFSFGKA